MHALKLKVTNGRLVLDEPTDLPDGAEEEVLVIDDEQRADERAALHASLDRALDDSGAERGTNAWDYLEQYRARPRGSSCSMKLNGGSKRKTDGGVRIATRPSF